jgi:hypothetical protein
MEAEACAVGPSRDAAAYPELRRPRSYTSMVWDAGTVSTNRALTFFMGTSSRPIGVCESASLPLPDPVIAMVPLSWVNEKSRRYLHARTAQGSDPGAGAALLLKHAPLTHVPFHSHPATAEHWPLA